MAEYCALSQLRSTRNRAKHLIDHVVPRVNRQVADHIVKPCQEGHVSRVKRVPRLGKGGPTVQAARDENIVGCRDRMIGDTNLAWPVSSNPLSVVNGNTSSRRIEQPRAASILAGGHVNIR